MQWRILAFLLVAVLATSGAPAQDDELAAEPGPSEPSFEFQGLVEVSEVTLDVLVTDAEGEVVDGLGRDDFIVEEDGQPVEVRSVSFYSTRYGEEQAEGTREIPWSRYFIFFFHNQWRFSYFGGDLILQQLRSAHESRRWVEEEMLPSDWVGVVSYGGELRVHQDFTQDRNKILRAMKAAAAGKKPPAGVSLRRGESGGQEFPILRRLPRGRELRQKVPDVYRALGTVAEACGYLVGRKNLLLFTIGLEENKSPSRQSELDPRHYPELETLLNDHNVAVYPIDISPAGRGVRQTDLLTQLAEDTGGSYFEDFVGFIHPIRDISGDNYAYYLLSYESERPAREIGYQRIEVRTRDEDLKVRARTGYRFGL